MEVDTTFCSAPHQSVVNAVVIAMIMLAILFSSMPRQRCGGERFVAYTTVSCEWPPSSRWLVVVIWDARVVLGTRRVCPRVVGRRCYG